MEFKSKNKFSTVFYHHYFKLQRKYYEMLRNSIFFRRLMVALTALTAPVLLTLICLPGVIDDAVEFIKDFCQELKEFYEWVPRGFWNGEER